MARHTFPEVPPRVEYSLTAKGRALVPLIDAMRSYGSEWLGVSENECRPAASSSRPPPPLEALARRRSLPRQEPSAPGANPARMRNRALHDALRDFALESAAFLTDDRPRRRRARVRRDRRRSRQRPVALSLPTADRGLPRRTAGTRSARCPAARRAAETLGAGAAPWLRVNGMRGEQAEPALRAMLERLYEDATSFAFPEERFERLYVEVETTLYRDAVRARVVAPLGGVVLESERVDLGNGLSLVAGEHADAPAEAAWPEDGGRRAVRALRARARGARGRADPGGRGRGALPRPGHGAATVGTRADRARARRGWRRSGEGRWGAVAVGGARHARGARPGRFTPTRRRICATSCGRWATRRAGGPVGWALGRFEMGCERPHDAEALSDYLLGLRALLDATTRGGRGEPRRCGWPRSAPRRASGGRCSAGWRPRCRSSAS